MPRCLGTKAESGVPGLGVHRHVTQVLGTRGPWAEGTGGIGRSWGLGAESAWDPLLQHWRPRRPRRRCCCWGPPRWPASPWTSSSCSSTPSGCAARRRKSEELDRRLLLYRLVHHRPPRWSAGERRGRGRAQGVARLGGQGLAGRGGAPGRGPTGRGGAGPRGVARLGGGRGPGWEGPGRPSPVGGPPGLPPPLTPSCPSAGIRREGSMAMGRPVTASIGATYSFRHNRTVAGVQDRVVAAWMGGGVSSCSTPVCVHV